MGSTAFVLLVLIHTAFCSNEYYWRAYDPSSSQIIPEAVEAGLSQTQANIYIGQTSIWGHPGIHTTTITQGGEVWAPYVGPKRATNFIQILCSPPSNSKRFRWLPATSSNLHLVGMDTHIVRGGTRANHATYIGRVKHQGNVVIGPVLTFDSLNPDMNFVFNGREYRVKSYEILTFDIRPQFPGIEPRLVAQNTTLGGLNPEN